MKKLTLPDDLFGDEKVVLYGTADEIQKHLNKTYGTTEPMTIEEGVKGQYRSLVPTDKRRATIRLVMLVKDRVEAKQRRGVLTHEITHLVMATFKYKNIPISHKNDEVFAYYHEWLCEQAWKVLT